MSGSGETKCVEDSTNCGLSDRQIWTAFSYLAQGNQGSSCEMGVALEGYEDEMFENCKKNEGHTDFIPLPRLGLQHLPKSCRHPDFLSYILNLASRTVLLTVYYTSEHRPDHFGWSTLKGKRAPRVGSGYLTVYKTKRDQAAASTQPASSTSSFHFGEDEETVLIVKTAAHVVYNQEEVKWTKVKLFFDDDSDRSTVIEAKGIRITDNSEEEDRSEFIIRLMNSELLPVVMKKLVLFESYNGPFPENIAFCVSHPHGVAKRVTFGEMLVHEQAEASFIPHQVPLEVVCEAESNLGIGEKKVLFYIVNVAVLHKTMTTLFSSEPSHSEYKRAILGHLIDQGLLQCPSKEELNQMSDTFSQRHGIQNDVVAQMFEDRECICRQGTVHLTSSTPPEGSDSPGSPGVRASDGNLAENFASRWYTLLKELIRKGLELYRGKPVPFDMGLNMMNKASYRVPTCPGSSGATVRCLSNVGGQKRLMYVPHSSAKTPVVCMGGGGVFMRVLGH
ncbi:uncharacterized protein LOC106013653 [Aplysia californica]|uniref:Uncharacterized protein LOC106013653 n=1 Tax=Aplysia californica TaxID=6500 RepID=A0ABM1AD28_APLCA|nr:uncharacterized protein LOC106013653 [Aplysia californica]